jgi:hypothetical protein
VASTVILALLGQSRTRYIARKPCAFLSRIDGHEPAAVLTGV